MAHIGNTGGLFNRGWEQSSVEFELTTGATVGIGVRGVTPAYHNWMSFSDFRLVQFPGDDTGVDSKEKNYKGTLIYACPQCPLCPFKKQSDLESNPPKSDNLLQLRYISYK